MKVNRNFAKHEYVTDYYHPENPDLEVNQASIDQALMDQQQEFQNICFEELTAQKAKLERKEQLRKEQQKVEVEALGSTVPSWVLSTGSTRTSSRTSDIL